MNNPRIRANPLTTLPSIAAAWLLIGTLPGCGPQVPDGMAVVRGSISLNGSPVLNGAVHFVPGDRTQAVAARIKRGRFSAVMRPMDCRLTVTADVQPELLDEKTGRLIPRVSLVPAKYGNVETSGLSTTVAAGLQTLTIELAN